MRILLFSEDGSRHSREVLELLLERIALRVEPGCATHQIDFEDGHAFEELARVVVGNLWRSRGGREERCIRDLRRTIATRLARGDFVLFHLDGDTPWSQRKSMTIAGQFDEKIREPVLRLLQLKCGGNGDGLCARLLTAIPHYSIEAWSPRSGPDSELGARPCSPCGCCSG